MPTLRPCLTTAALLALLLPAGAQSPAATAPPAPAPAAHDLNLGAMDTGVSPGDDFYRYANGHWLDTTAIPPEYASWGSFAIVQERNLEQLHVLAERAAADTGAKPGSVEGKVGSFYRSGMDEARIEADGAKPLAPELARIGAVHDAPGLLAEIGRLHRLGVPAGFGTGVGPDIKDPKQTVRVGLNQGGLGLPDRGYYLRTDAATQATRDAYVAHIARMMALLGEAPAQARTDAGAVLALETKLAQASKPRVELRDPQANYHKTTPAGLDALTPGLTWRPYFDALGLRRLDTLQVGQPAFFTAVGQAIAATPLADWKAYLRWHLVHAEAPQLSRAFVDENFQFYSTTLQGVPQIAPRWKRVLRTTDAALGEALGQLYVAQAFPPAAKARSLALVQNLKSVLRGDLTALPWMTEATRQQALLKLDAMAIKIGYPDHWRDYSKLDVTSPSYAVNAMRAGEFRWQRELAKVGKPLDRAEWSMSPPTVNAYYSPTENDINFPAGILQPPFFDPQADDAINYGAIGAVIGHEMTHGFDDQGRQFAAGGDLRDWWTPADAQAFRARAQNIVAQYDAFTPLPGAHINGSLTQGENIADIGGLKIAYLALEKDLQGKPRTPIDGFTPEQRFFLAYAQVWQTKLRPESLRVSLATDPHSPPQYRVLGALADTPEFRQAFSLPADPKAVPTTIW